MTNSDLFEEVTSLLNRVAIGTATARDADQLEALLTQADPDVELEIELDRIRRGLATQRDCRSIEMAVL